MTARGANVGAMLGSSSRNLLPIVAAYLPVPMVGAALSAKWDVGATPDGDASDMFLRGTALTPPLFLPVALLADAALAREPGARGRVGAGLVSLVAAAFFAGSTANLPTDVAAALERPRLAARGRARRFALATTGRWCIRDGPALAYRGHRTDIGAIAISASGTATALQSV